MTCSSQPSWSSCAPAAGPAQKINLGSRWRSRPPWGRWFMRKDIKRDPAVGTMRRPLLCQASLWRQRSDMPRPMGTTAQSRPTGTPAAVHQDDHCRPTRRTKVSASIS